MTGANREANTAEELARAEESLREAEVLRSGGLARGAVARAYYAVFHAARALLFSAGLEASTHRGTVALVGLHFVKPGSLPPEMGRLLSRMQRDREDADYATGAVFTNEEAAQALADAKRFMDEIQRMIRPTGSRP